jgi:hypothetical protein
MPIQHGRSVTGNPFGVKDTYKRRSCYKQVAPSVLTIGERCSHLPHGEFYARAFQLFLNGLIPPTMYKPLFILLFFSLVTYGQGQNAIIQDYSFLATDGEVSKLHKSNDTLYTLKCYINKPCQPKPKAHYKILSSVHSGEYLVLKLEKLDTIPLTSYPFPETRHQVWVMKMHGNKELSLWSLAFGLTRQEVDRFQPAIDSIRYRFAFTYFSDSYLEELSHWKTVATKSEALELREFMQSERFKPLADLYSKSLTGDMYGAGFSAEILSRACIEKGFNPVGAGRAIKALMRQ